ncbi:probable splicing factor YJU2B [Pezoporus wallicus]|uniref:probable splicing factor YJU2B n=1 Tax=Pezoporus wallicus TaxID=35540 RepID=UPI002550C391|nr:probable splicing factor YJU2B [Pezoporus wallicus]XP_061299844.1 probable splicing factor YJU2B [Pezoporus flaviventris]
MGERKGTNKYYPPDFDPAKHRSLNKYHGSHPLRERARKLAQGILVIRFEMPFNIWCDGCKNHIGMGVRYNAEKTKVGNYYTTPIYRFRMKCHLCVNHIELQTDPAGCDYVIVSGARRKEERWDMAENQQVLPTEREARERLASDAMFRLEHGAKDRECRERAGPGLAALQHFQSLWKDDFGINCRLRSHFREQKPPREEPRPGLGIALLPEEPQDRRVAALLALQSPLSYEDKQRQKRTEISSRPWFPAATGDPPRKPAPGGGTPRTPPPTRSTLGIIRRGDPPAGTPPKHSAEPRGGAEHGGGWQSTPTTSLVADYSDSSSDSS